MNKPDVTENLNAPPRPLQQVVGRLACKIGIHDWRSDSDYFMGIVQCTEVCLFWWTCERCGVSKLKHITR